jgi:pilus assembly protein CpaC
MEQTVHLVPARLLRLRRTPTHCSRLRRTKWTGLAPICRNVPLIMRGCIFQSRNLNRSNTELLVIVTPELVRPIPAGQQPPALKYPKEFLKTDSPGQMRTPGETGTAPVSSAMETMPIEKLTESMKTPDLNIQGAGQTSNPLQSPSSSQSSTTTAPSTQGTMK